jgi:tRNA pseudouridine55 synthase
VPREPRRPVDGVLLLDKPSGLTSNAALQRAKRLYRAEKAGHTGTLDPLASGLLPLCFGEATKFAQRLLDAPKGYIATIRFGATTTTGDSEGEPVRMRPVAFDPAMLESASKRFVGRQSQMPPMHSALKFQGRAYYDYARKGEEIPRSPRDIVVHAFELLEWNSPDAVVSIACSKGTYVRVLAEDLGEALGCGAHLTALRRTATGGFRVEDALTLDGLEAIEDARRLASLLPTAALVADLPRIDVGEAQCRRFRQGQALPAGGFADGDFAVFAGAAFVGLAEVSGGVAHPRRLVVERVRPA